MTSEPLIALLQQRQPALLAVYAFGSRIGEQGQAARVDSDLDLPVLLEGYADPVGLFDLSGDRAYARQIVLHDAAQ
jgi:hypothetical protein